MSNASAVMYEKGPVRVVEMFGDWCVRNTSGVVAQCLSPGLENGKEVAAANARRIAACWNACEGIPTEALEAGVVRELVELLRTIHYLHRDYQDQPEKLHGAISDAVWRAEELLHEVWSASVLAKVRGETS